MKFLFRYPRHTALSNPMVSFDDLDVRVDRSELPSHQIVERGSNDGRVLGERRARQYGTNGKLRLLKRSPKIFANISIL